MRWRSAAGWAEGVWALALALLLVNDHALKRSGWLPGLVTGKLSDFAGLVVAPVVVAVLAALAGVRGPRVRLACFAAVTVPFAAIKLSTDAAGALESMLALAGVPSRIWSDPTDLVALGVLPFAWHVSVALEARVAEMAPRLRHMLGAMLGGVACLATSEEPPWQYRTSAYLVNMARTHVGVEVSRVTAVLDCNALDASVASLAASDFEPALCAGLSPVDILPLDRDFDGGDSGDLGEGDEEEPPCDAVLLGASGLAPTIVFWQKGKSKTVTNGDAVSELDPSAVYLESVGESNYLAGSSAMHVRTLDEPVPEVDCTSLEEPEEID